MAYFCAALLFMACLAEAQTVQQARVFSGAGGTASNLQFVAHTSNGQFQPVGTAQSSSLYAQLGFMNSFVMNPTVDTDGDGAIDENDRDDDNDRLSDLDEITGAGFSPVTVTDPLLADSDSDGMDDGAESIAGTDPSDANARLVITDIQRNGNQLSLTWTGRAGREYDLVAESAVTALGSSTQIVSQVTSTGGTAPWFETIASSTNLPIREGQVFRVHVRTP
jgi:hypothetical protein